MKKKKLLKKIRAALAEAAVKILADENSLSEDIRDQEAIARANRWLELAEQGEKR